MDEGVLHELECAVCQNYMCSAIGMCRAGHSICGKCKNAVNRCPICRTAFSDGRNFTLEAIIEKLQIPCKYGCSTTTRIVEMQEHEEDCPQRNDRECFASGCSWKGTCSETKAHLRNHPDLFSSLPALDFSSLKVQCILSMLGELFYLKIIKIDNYCNFIVKYVGSKNNAKFFLYHIKFTSENEYKKYTAFCEGLYGSEEQGFLLSNAHFDRMVAEKWEYNNITFTRKEK